MRPAGMLMKRITMRNSYIRILKRCLRMKSAQPTAKDLLECWQDAPLVNRFRRMHSKTKRKIRINTIYYNICPAEVSLLDSMLKRKEYSNTGKYVFPGIAYDCSLNWYRRFLKSAGNGRVHKKRVSYLYRTATTTYPCLIPHLGESVGAGRIRLTPAQKYEFLLSLQRKKELSAILSLFFESRMPKRLPGCVSEGGAGRVNE